MKRCFLLLIVLLVLTAASLSFASNAVPEFSAVYVEKEGESVETGNIYVSDTMTRYDKDNGREILVIRYDKKVMWTIYPKIRCYIEDDYPMSAPVAHLDGPKEGQFGDLTREFIGHEEVDTYRMKKYLVSILLKGDPENKYEYYEWYRDNFPLPVKTAAVYGNSSYEFTKIKLGKPSIELFMQPKGYKKITHDEIKIKEREKKIKSK